MLTVEGTAVAVTGDDDHPDGSVRVGHGDTIAAFVGLEQFRGPERMIRWGEKNESRANVVEQRGRKGVLCVKLRQLYTRRRLEQVSRRGDSPCFQFPRLTGFRTPIRTRPIRQDYLDYT